MGTVKHLLYTPFTGLGLYGGHRGNRWLRNRIKIFKQFVVPSLQAQTNKDFMLWISWRAEDRGSKLIQELGDWLSRNTDIEFFFSYSGVCFWDDKYPDDVAHSRLIDALHGAVPALANNIGEAQTILVTLQPSDDCYKSDAVAEIQATLLKSDYQAFAYKRGYVCDYTKLNVSEWNPSTNPPFYTIKFDRATFLNPLDHVRYAGIKSHEYLPQQLRTFDSAERGFLVGTHGENISTIYEHPFRFPLDQSVSPYSILLNFGLEHTEALTLPISLRKKIMRKLPHNWQRKLRYILGEKFAAKIYDLLRS